MTFPLTRIVRRSHRCLLGMPKSSATFSAISTSRIGIIGGGQIAEAIINAQKIKGFQDMSAINVFDVHDARLSYLVEKYGITAHTSAQDAVNASDIVILAVKPQNVSAVAATLTKAPSGVLLSIVAGLTISEIRRQFKISSIIRSMPNTPAMVLEGMTVWTATHETPKELIEKAKGLLGSFGDHIEVTDENYLDMATAISGSGPAVSIASSSFCP
jgi:pyrroline-5-carboxylate reductase